MKKVSFLIAAHNEEKIIKHTIENLLNIPYNNLEIIVGLDGCIDKTKEIVKKISKKSKKVKFFELKLRQGKPAVINNIIKKAKGEIIIIHDADWLLINQNNFEKFISIFNDEKIGGIAESFPAEWHLDRLKKGDLGYKMGAYSSYLWFNFQKKYFTTKKNDSRYINEPAMFLTNVFRKKLYEENSSLGDDFERTHDIIKKGYKIIILDDINMPRIKTTYNKIKVSDLFKLKIRTAIGRKQLAANYETNVGFFNYYLPVIFYISFNSIFLGFRAWAISNFWILLTILSTVISKFINLDTKEGWKIRIER